MYKYFIGFEEQSQNLWPRIPYWPGFSEFRDTITFDGRIVTIENTTEYKGELPDKITTDFNLQSICTLEPKSQDFDRIKRCISDLVELDINFYMQRTVAGRLMKENLEFIGYRMRHIKEQFIPTEQFAKHFPAPKPHKNDQLGLFN